MAETMGTQHPERLKGIQLFGGDDDSILSKEVVLKVMSEFRIHVSPGLTPPG